MVRKGLNIRGYNIPPPDPALDVVRGDRISNVLWMIEYHKYPPAICDTFIIQVGTNDVTNRRSNTNEIASGIMQVVSALFKNKSDVTIILTGIFPGQRKPVYWCG